MGNSVKKKCPNQRLGYLSIFFTGAHDASINVSAASLIKTAEHDRNSVYVAVLQLQKKAQLILDRNRKKLNTNGQKQVIQAAESFIYDLSYLLSFQQNILQNISLAFQHLLAENCINIISNYKARLTAAPGFWNQIKVLINDFIGLLTGANNILLVEKTVFAESKSFKKMMNTIFRLEEEIQEKIDIDDDVCIFNMHPK